MLSFDGNLIKIFRRVDLTMKGRHQNSNPGQNNVTHRIMFELTFPFKKCPSLSFIPDF